MTRLVSRCRSSFRNSYIRYELCTGAIVLDKEICLMAMAKCPDCEADIEVADDAMMGEILSCPDCGLDLEVKTVASQKVELEKLAIEKEDWGE